MTTVNIMDTTLTMTRMDLRSVKSECITCMVNNIIGMAITKKRSVSATVEEWTLTIIVSSTIHVGRVIMRLSAVRTRFQQPRLQLQKLKESKWLSTRSKTNTHIFIVRRLPCRCSMDMILMRAFSTDRRLPQS